MHALQIFPCDTTTVERQRVESQHSMVIIILLLLHSSPDGPHLIIPATSLSPSPFPHIPVFISFPSPPDFVSFGSRQEQRKGDSQKHREIERKQRMTRVRHKETEGCKRKERRKRGVSFLWKAFVLIGPSKIPSASQYPEKICYNHLVSLLHPSFIDLSQPSLFQLVSKYAIALPWDSLTFALNFPYYLMSFSFTAHPC